MHLEKNGINHRIDHRSYADQGIDKKPTIHLGRAAKRMIERGHSPKGFRMTDRGKTRSQHNDEVRKTNAERARARIDHAQAKEAAYKAARQRFARSIDMAFARTYKLPSEARRAFDKLAAAKGIEHAVDVLQNMPRTYHFRTHGGDKAREGTLAREAMRERWHQLVDVARDSGEMKTMLIEIQIELTRAQKEALLKREGVYHAADLTFSTKVSHDLLDDSIKDAYRTIGAHKSRQFELERQRERDREYIEKGFEHERD